MPHSLPESVGLAEIPIPDFDFVWCHEQLVSLRHNVIPAMRLWASTLHEDVASGVVKVNESRGVLRRICEGALARTVLLHSNARAYLVRMMLDEARISTFVTSALNGVLLPLPDVFDEFEDGHNTCIHVILESWAVCNLPRAPPIIEGFDTDEHSPFALEVSVFRALRRGTRRRVLPD